MCRPDKAAEARADAAAEADVKAGRVVPHESVREWLMRLVKGEKVPRDGTLHWIMPDGREVAMPAPGPLAPMTDAEVHAAAMKDPDARPMTDEEFARARPVPRAKTLRRALGLTQEEFATRFLISLGTLRDWEQGKSEPDQTARAYLKAIAADADAVQRALRAAEPVPR